MAYAHTIESLMGRMTAGKFRHVPVVEQGKLVGIVSIGDVVKSRVEEIDTKPQRYAITSSTNQIDVAPAAN